MNDHPDRETLYLFFEDPESFAAGNPSVDLGLLRAHVQACQLCQASIEIFRDLTRVLSDGEMLKFIAGLPEERERVKQSRRYQEFVGECERNNQEKAAADEFLPRLAAAPFGEWEAILREEPEHRTYTVAEYILTEAEAQLNRRPSNALLLIDVAGRVAADLTAINPIFRLTLEGDVWRLRASAYRHLFRLEESLESALRAEDMYCQLRASSFPVATAWHTRAGTLFKMTRWAEALQLNAEATAVLREYGPSLPLAKTLVLEAGIRLEQGEIVKAQSLWHEAVLILESLEESQEQARIEIARCYANLAECDLRLGNYEKAIDESERAMQRYRALHMDTEAIRSSWTLGMAQLHSEHSFALDHLERCASEFEALQMYGDAGFVRLDIVGALLRGGEYERAEPLARELVHLFTKAAVPIAAIYALEYLRESITHRLADPPLVDYIRDYVAANDPARPFAPPGVQ